MIRVLSLFNGMNCIGLALKELGIEFELYASEIDKHANKVSNALFPNTIELGDVRDVNPYDLPKFDLLVAGSPCQGFSKAGNQLNFEHEKSKLFFEFVRILNDCKKINPDLKWLLENVEMKKEWAAIISRFVGIDPIHINSKLLSAQSRPRMYWTNIGTNTMNLLGIHLPGIKQPKDKNVYLKDILELDVGEEYSVKLDVNLKPKKNQLKARCLTGGGNSGGNHSDMDLVMIVAQRGRYKVDGKRQDSKGSIAGKSTQTLECRYDNKTNCLTTVQKDNFLLIVPEATKKGYAEIENGECVDLTFPDSKTRRGRKMKDKSNALTASKYDFFLFKDAKIRRLTEVECMRLQTIPKWAIEKIKYMLDKKEISSTQVYKMLGNGWTVDVISYILSHFDWRKLYK